MKYLRKSYTDIRLNERSHTHTKCIIHNSTYRKFSKTKLIYGDRRKGLGDKELTGKGHMGGNFLG